MNETKGEGKIELGKLKEGKRVDGNRRTSRVRRGKEIRSKVEGKKRIR